MIHFAVEYCVRKLSHKHCSNTRSDIKSLNHPKWAPLALIVPFVQVKTPLPCNVFGSLLKLKTLILYNKIVLQRNVGTISWIKLHCFSILCDLMIKGVLGVLTIPSPPPSSHYMRIGVLIRLSISIQ